MSKIGNWNSVDLSEPEPPPEPDPYPAGRNPSPPAPKPVRGRRKPFWQKMAEAFSNVMKDGSSSERNQTGG